MKNFSIFAVLLVCFGIAACGSPSQYIAKTHGVDVISVRNPELLMNYDFWAQASEAEGRVLMDHGVVGQSKTPVPVYPPVSVSQSPPQTPPAPQRPVYGRAAKAVPRTPPPAAPCPPSPPQPVYVLPQPQVLATAKEGGTTTKHDVAAAIPGALGNAVGMTTFGTTFGAIQKVGKNVINNTLGQQQGQGQETNSLNANWNSSTATGTGIGTGTGTGVGVANGR